MTEEDDLPTASKAWLESWAARLEELKPYLAETNAIIPMTGWMTTRVANKDVTHHLHPMVLAWAAEKGTKIEIGSVDILGYDSPTMVFESFAMLLMFKLAFQ